MVAQTSANRLLTILFEVEAHSVYRIITAYDTNSEQRHAYEAR